MTEADRERIAALGNLCELAAKSAHLSDIPTVVRFHEASAAHFSALAFKAAQA